MERAEIIEAFDRDLLKVMQRYQNVGVLTLGDVIGVLELMKLNLFCQMRDAQNSNQSPTGEQPT